MPAYMRSLTRKCQDLYCRRHSTVVVYNRHNVVVGQYCAACGDRLVKRLNEPQPSQS